jgi:hypothetical protein
MGKIIWLASYPKSGNTWLRIFLHNLLRDPPDGYDINQASDFCVLDSSVLRFEKFLKTPWIHWSAEDIANTRWDVQRLICMRQKDDLFAKTHNAFTEFKGKPLIYPEFTAGAIYVVRNPLDVCISLADHYGVNLDQAIRILNDPEAGAPSDGQAVYEIHRSWALHVQSWTGTMEAGKLVIRYEDMLRQPEIAFGRVAKFLGLQPTADRLQRAIRNSSFDKLRGQEEKVGFKERGPKATRFFRVGKSDQWRTVLSESQVDRVVRKNMQQMQRFGYWSPS